MRDLEVAQRPTKMLLTLGTRFYDDLNSVCLKKNPDHEISKLSCLVVHNCR